MAKSLRTEDALRELGRVRDNPTSEQALKQLGKALKSRSSHLVAKAAQIAGECEIASLAPLMAAAFGRFMIDAEKSDKGCSAKTAVAQALYRLEYPAEEIYLAGIRHRQLEPAWGGTMDTACPLRAACAMGLAGTNYPDALAELSVMLADAEASVRIAAAQAIAYHGAPHGAPVLRLKARSGDSDPQVVSECLSALVKIAPGPSLSFVAEFLDDPDPLLGESAALALGESRMGEAFDYLRQWWSQTVSVDRRRTALLAMAILRHDDALTFLVSQIAEGSQAIARSAVEALHIYASDVALKERVVVAANTRTDIDLSDAIAKSFL